MTSTLVEGETISSIGKGLLVLVGIGHDDTTTDSNQLIRKILNLRLFDAPPPGSDGSSAAAASVAVAVGGASAQAEAVDSGSGPGAASAFATTNESAEKESTTNSTEEVSNRERSLAWKKSVMDISGEILCVSQFTLMARTEKGSKPDFHQAMPGTTSKPMYEDFLTGLGRAYSPGKIKDGKFAAMMNVSLCNEGPVTILLDTKTSPNSSSDFKSVSASSSRPGTPASGTKGLTPEEMVERGKEKARLSRERRSRAKVEWEARKREEGASTGTGV